MRSMGGMGGYTPSLPTTDITPAEPPRPAYNPPAKTSNKAMKWGGKGKDVDSFVDQLAQEGVKVTNTLAPAKTGLSKPAAIPEMDTEAVHVTLEEKIMLTAGRDGGLQSMELVGMLTLRVAEDNVGRVRLALENTELELNDVTIAIPLPHGCGTPNISECEGDYTHDTRRQQLLWQHTVIDQNNKTGAMEFSCGGSPDDFFPVGVSFTSSKSYSGIKVLECSQVDGGQPVKFSSSVQFFADKYEIV